MAMSSSQRWYSSQASPDGSLNKDFLRCSRIDRKSTRLNSSHLVISYAVFCLKKNNNRPSSQQLATSYALSGSYFLAGVGCRGSWRVCVLGGTQQACAERRFNVVFFF